MSWHAVGLDAFLPVCLITILKFEETVSLPNIRWFCFRSKTKQDGKRIDGSNFIALEYPKGGEVKFEFDITGLVASFVFNKHNSHLKTV